MKNMTRMRWCVCLMTVIGMVFPGAAAPGGESQCVVEGKVFDSAKRCGIAGAVIELPLGLETRRAAADSSGRFVISGIPAGRGFIISASMRGYRMASAEITVAPGDTARVELTMPSIYIVFLAPKGGRRFVAGTDVLLRWESGGIETVRIEFSTDGGERWRMIAEGVEASRGEWLWSVPDSPTSRGVIRVIVPGRPEVEARTDSLFSVTST